MIEIREYKDGDYEALDDCVEGVGLGEINEVLPISILATATQDGEPIIVGGLVFADETLAWVRLSSKASIKHTAVRIIRESFKIMADACEVDELTAYVRDSFPEGEKMARAIKMNPTEDFMQDGEFTYRKYTWTQ